jgi:hypothetical protein
MGSSRAWCEEEDHGRLHCHEKIKEKIFASGGVKLDLDVLDYNHPPWRSRKK